MYNEFVFYVREDNIKYKMGEELMNILLKHITRNIKENVGRTTLIMLSLFVVSILVAIITLGILFIIMMSDASSNLASFEYQIQSTTGEYILNDVVNEVKNEFNILAMPEMEYGYLIDKEGNYITTELDGLQVRDAIDFKFININEDNVELNENETIISSKLAKNFDLKEGNEFEYYGRDGRKNILKVKYIVPSLTSLTPVEIVTNEETYLKILDEDEISYVMLFGTYKGDNSEINNDIDKFEMKCGLNFYKNEESTFEIIVSYLYPAVIIGILVFAVIFVSLNSIVKIIINERVSTIGTFRSIGATKKQVVKMLILEMLMYTVIPAILGACIGILATKGMSSIIEMMLRSFGSSEKIDLTKYIFPVSAITVIVTVLFQMILSIMELLKVSKMSIKDSIFNKHTSIYKYSDTKIILGLFFLCIGIITIVKYTQLTYWYCLIGILSVFISIALIVPTVSKWLIKVLEKSKNPIIAMTTNTLKNSSLQINTNIIFIITVSVSLVIYSFFNYMASVEKSKQNQVNSDIYVEEIGADINSIYDKTDEFYKLENVKSVSSIFDITINEYQYDTIKFANHTVDEIHLVYSNDYESLLNSSNLLNVEVDLAKNLGKYEIIVSEYYKNVYGLKEGDIVVLNWSTNEEHFEMKTPINLKIVGFADLSKLQNNTIITSSELGQELNQLLFNGYSNTKYFINLNDNSIEMAKETRKTIISELGIHSNTITGNVFTKEGYVKNAKNSSETYMGFMIFIVVVIVGLALIGIINNQTVSFMERRRELATLYSIALSRKQLKNMILIENLLAFMNSTIASVVFYIIISKLVEYTLQILLIPISMKFTISGILVLLLVVAMILLVIQKSMREHIKNMNIVEEIKYE